MKKSRVRLWNFMCLAHIFDLCLQPSKAGSTVAISSSSDDPRHFTKPDYSLYHKSDVLLNELTKLVERHPDVLQLDVQRLQRGGYATELHCITLATQGHKPLANESDTRIRALLDFGQHGREPVTSEVALRLIATLLGEREGNAGYGESELMEFQEQLLPHMVIKIIPMENVNGRHKVEAGNLCERKNGRGVDPNRNWSIDWGKKEKDYDPREEYPGTGPFSEPEAELVRILASEFKPHLWVNVHSGMEALFMPYDHVKKVPQDGSAPVMESLLHKINKLHLSKQCVVGSGGTSVGYLAHGTATDWMFVELKVPMAFTFEIYGDPLANGDDCFRMFNPITKVTFERVMSTWTAVFISLFRNLPDALNRIPFRTGEEYSWSIESKASDTPTSTLTDRQHVLFVQFPGKVSINRVGRKVWLQDGWNEISERNVLSVQIAILLMFLCIAAYFFAKRRRARWAWKLFSWPSTLGGRTSFSSRNGL